jgi:hypothetical protein
MIRREHTRHGPAGSGGATSQDAGDTVGSAKQPFDGLGSKTSDPDLRSNTDGQDARVDQLGERRARRHAFEHLEEDEHAHLEPNDPCRDPVELTDRGGPSELSDEHGRHRREGDRQREVVGHAEVCVPRLVQDLGARVRDWGYKPVREPVPREHAAGRESERREPASSEHWVDCRLTADEREVEGGTWIHETSGTWVSWAAA